MDSGKGLVVHMKVLVIVTGGTISSSIQGEYIGVKDKVSKQILTKYINCYKTNCEFDTIEPFTILSEQSDGRIIQMLCRTVKEQLSKGYAGMIVTHGTDTLQYSAAALSYVVGADSIPICLVSSNYPLEDKRANGLSNLHGAVTFIENRCGRGVFVSYANRNGIVEIHRASRLLGSHAYSDLVFSMHNQYYGVIDKDFIFRKNQKYNQLDDEIEPFEVKGLEPYSKEIMVVTPIVGFSAPNIGEKVKYILINTYHSGTIPSYSKEIIRFIEEAKEQKIKILITGVTNDISYESTKVYKEYGFIPVYNVAPIATYMKLWLGVYSQFDVVDILECSLGGDVVV